MIQDHEVFMAQKQLDAIIKHATELKSKIGQSEKDLPAWIQDHISNAENYIHQASEGFYTNESIKPIPTFDKFINEAKSKTIEVTVYGGKTINYTDTDIKEFLDDIDMYLGADNLPKWLLNAGIHNRKFPRNKQAVAEMLEKILKAPNDVLINLRSDKPYENTIKGI